MTGSGPIERETFEKLVHKTKRDADAADAAELRLGGV